MNNPDNRRYLLNANRVLLTRARQGMVIFVPPGDRRDPTRPPDNYDPIFSGLTAVGIPALVRLRSDAAFTPEVHWWMDSTVGLTKIADGGRIEGVI